MAKGEKIDEYTIVILEKESSFSNQLYSVLTREVEKYKNVNISIIKISNPNAIKSYNIKKTDIAFIDLSVVDEDFSVLSSFLNIEADSFLVLLISDEDGLNIRNAVEMFRSQKHYFFDEHILKDNYSSNILSFFCREMIRKMINNN